MDDQNAGSQQSDKNLISRPPTQADLVDLCRELNQRDAKYMVIGGLEDQLAFTDEFKAKIERGEQDLREGRTRVRKP